MALVNVNRKNTDQFYRYKMPKLLAKVRLYSSVVVNYCTTGLFNFSSVFLNSIPFVQFLL